MKMPLALMVVVWSALPLPAVEGFATIHQQLKRYCLECHDQELRRGGLDLERFTDGATALADRNTWLAILDKVETGQMPPPRETRQPTVSERAALGAFIRRLCAEPDPQLQARDPGRPPLRRLTRLEVNNTLRDLLGITQDCFQMPERLPYVQRLPGRTTMGETMEVRTREYGARYPVLLHDAGLPGDNRAEHGFRNRGDAGSFSPLILEQYLLFAQNLAHSEAFAQTPFAALLLAPVPGGAPAERRAAAERWRTHLPRLLRRPVSADELQAAIAEYDHARTAGKDFAEAMRTVFAARLASVGFLMRSEAVRPGGPRVRRLDAFELANRLSYFLWASAPDAELSAVAGDGSLLQDAVLVAQVRRMLGDPRSRELSESFAVQWLRLDQLYAARPDRDRFKAFYDGPQGKSTLHSEMLTEALLLFDTVRLENRSILDLVAPSFTWLNPRLAEHYGLTSPTRPAAVKTISNKALKELPAAEQKAYRAAKDAESTALRTWTRVTLTDRTRGGYLTMAAPLLITSLPQRTSPVKRGAWLLETIFNRPPSEPKVAFSIDDEATTSDANLSVRERLEAHRTKAACQSCHSRLDPPGFALERFDAVGRWRERDGASPVDASGSWHGQAFDGPAAFKDLLVRDPGEFTQGFVEHLLSYALCRRLEAFDLPAVEAITAAVAADGHRFEAVVLGIVRSHPFQWVRNVP